MLRMSQSCVLTNTLPSIESRKMTVVKMQCSRPEILHSTVLVESYIARKHWSVTQHKNHWTWHCNILRCCGIGLIDMIQEKGLYNVSRIFKPWTCRSNRRVRPNTPAYWDISPPSSARSASLGLLQIFLSLRDIWDVSTLYFFA